MDTGSHSSSSRLVDNAHAIQTGDLCSIISCLLLRVVEVSRHRNNSLADWLVESLLGSLLHGLEHDTRDLLDALWASVWHINLASVAIASNDVEVPLVLVRLHVLLAELLANHALRVINPGRLSASALTNDNLTGGSEANPRGGRVLTRAVRCDLNAVRLGHVDTHARVRGTKIDSDNWFAHITSYEGCVSLTFLLDYRFDVEFLTK